MKSRSPKQPSVTSPTVLSKDGVPLARVRRAPNPWGFLVTGGVLGMVLGVVLNAMGEDGSYQPSSAAGYFAVLFGALGMLVGGLAFVLADRRS